MADERLKVLLANQDEEELRGLAELVEAAGHEVIALAISQAEVGDALVGHSPEVALVLVEDDPDHAIDLILELRGFAEIPLIAMARTMSDDGARQAAEFGVDVLHLPSQAETIDRVIASAAKRHEERSRMMKQIGDFESATQRRATIEQAKGILMERKGISSREAFNEIRDHARRNQLRVGDVAHSVVAARELLSLDGPEK